MTSKEKQNGFTADQARAVLEQQDRENRAIFVEAYQDLCNQYGFEIVGSPIFLADGRVGVQLTVRAK